MQEMEMTARNLGLEILKEKKKKPKTWQDYLKL